MSEDEVLQRKISFLAETLAKKGLADPVTVLESRISDKVQLGKTRGQAIDELYQEEMTPTTGKVEGPTLENLQRTIDEERGKMLALVGRLETASMEINGVRRNLKIAFAACLVLILIVGALSAFALSGDLATARTWHDVNDFAGVDDTTTSTFQIPGEHWRIVWIAKSTDPENGVFSFFVYPEGETDKYIGIVYTDFYMGTLTMETQGGIEYITGNAGPYYIEVLAANLQSWSITVESYH